MAQPAERPAEPVPLWRNRDYVLLWSGQAVSVIGSATSDIAFPFLILFLTGSPFQAGLAGFLARLPFLILGLPAGALADRWDRKRVMIVCDTLRALTFGLLVAAGLSGHLIMPLLYALVLVEGICFSFFNVAEVAALPQIVARSQLAQASAQNNLMYGLSALLGPSLGGVLYSTGRMLPFLVDAVSYAVSVGALLFIRVPFQTARLPAETSLWQEIGEGLRWLWDHTLIRFIAIVTSLNGFVMGGLPLAVIVLARDQFHASAALVGFVFGVAAVGGIIGAVGSPWIIKRTSAGAALLLGLWATGLIMPFLALGPSLAALAAAGFGLYLVGPVYDTAQFSYRMARIPDALQGRVNSVYRMIIMAGPPVGQLLVGFLLQVLPPRSAILVLAGGAVLVAVVASVHRDLRQAGAI